MILMETVKNKRKKTSERYGHLMVERETFEKASAFVREKGYRMSKWASRALEAFIKKGEF